MGFNFAWLAASWKGPDVWHSPLVHRPELARRLVSKLDLADDAELGPLDPVRATNFAEFPGDYREAGLEESDIVAVGAWDGAFVLQSIAVMSACFGDDPIPEMAETILALHPRMKIFSFYVFEGFNDYGFACFENGRRLRLRTGSYERPETTLDEGEPLAEEPSDLGVPFTRDGATWHRVIRDGEETEEPDWSMVWSLLHSASRWIFGSPWDTLPLDEMPAEIYAPRAGT